MKGYLFIQAVAEFEHERRHIEYDEPCETKMSYAAKGWYPIEPCIKSGGFIKFSSERLGVRVEAKFNIVKNVPGGDNGSYEINRGPFSGTGVFRNVSKRENENPDFKEFYVCHAVSNDGRKYLRWKVGVNDYVDADKMTDDEKS